MQFAVRRGRRLGGVSVDVGVGEGVGVGCGVSAGFGRFIMWPLCNAGVTVVAWSAVDENADSMLRMKSALMHRAAGFASFLRFIG